ncbi:MAG: enediyne core biosynthesis thioesterase [Solirubrobacteraceae bacterium]|nr:enediyne core biosynthesis thioesterase [Solirubrobacteraceae bacterium]
MTAARKTYEYRHTVMLEETNLLGNVYFSHYARWQGHCRELFLREFAPEVLLDLDPDRDALVTTRCACTYLAELVAFDQVSVRMGLGDVALNRLDLHFEYVRVAPGPEELVARGEQQLAWLQRDGERFVPRRVPESLLTAIEAYPGRAGRRPPAVGGGNGRVQVVGMPCAPGEPEGPATDP